MLDPFQPRSVLPPAKWGGGNFVSAKLADRYVCPAPFSPANPPEGGGRCNSSKWSNAQPRPAPDSQASGVGGSGRLMASRTC